MLRSKRRTELLEKIHDFLYQRIQVLHEMRVLSHKAISRVPSVAVDPLRNKILQEGAGVGNVTKRCPLLLSELGTETPC